MAASKGLLCGNHRSCHRAAYEFGGRASQGVLQAVKHEGSFIFRLQG
jgi:hypothetical protein